MLPRTKAPRATTMMTKGKVEAGPAGESSDASTMLILALAATLALFAWTAPNHYPPWLSFHGEFAMAVSAMLAGAWVLWRARPKRTLLPVLTLMTLAAALLPGAQLAGGVIDFAGDAWLVSLYLVGFALAQWVGFRAAAAWGLGRAVELLEWVVLGGALVSVWLALYQWQALDYLGIAAIDISSGMRPYANLIQPNQLATLLVLGLIATALLYDQGRLGVAASLLAVVTLGFGLAMTQSRAGLLEVVVIAALFILRRDALARRLSLHQLLLGVGLVLTMPFAWDAVRGWSVLATGRDNAEMATVGLRRIHWESMLDAIGRQPWFGYGWNQVGAAQFAVAPDHAATGETLAQSHNLVLDLLVCNGIPVGVALTAGLACWFWAALRGTRDSSALLALASVVAVFVHAMLEYPLHYAYFLVPVGVLMGAVSAVTMPRGALEVPRWLAPVLLVVASGATLVTGFEYVRLEEDVRHFRFAQARVGTRIAPYEHTDVVFLTQLGQFLDFARTPEREGMSAGELRQMAAVVRRFPSKENTVRYAAALAINGRPADASDALRRVCKTNPELACEAMKSLWRALGERKPPIAEVPWPAD